MEAFNFIKFIIILIIELNFLNLFFSWFPYQKYSTNTRNTTFTKTGQEIQWEKHEKDKNYPWNLTAEMPFENTLKAVCSSQSLKPP